ncbi:M64 family metallopeptidase [Streptomyces physcomitrii]|uniref:M64 family metallopeptidase n=1 Tax=Streptomyces physcomitrii TaxID=2724184 RepID=UPI0033F15D99
MHRARVGAAAGAILAAVLAAATAPVSAAPDPGAADTSPRGGSHHVEYFSSPTAHPRPVEVPAATPERMARASAAAPAPAGDGDVGQVVNNGSTADKLDVVVIGDGYTEGEQERFHTDAKEKWQDITGVEPYTTYQNLFNVWTVDAVSRESGVSGDPGQDVVKDTALSSYFWCDGLERLLCVDTGKVEGYAAKAPAADLVIVISNSTKYGGAGYNDVSSTVGYDGIATLSGGNEQSGQIAVHETGHSLGKLADEYTYEQYGRYTGAETGESNTSVYDAGQLEARQAKWYRWLGEPTPDGGVIGAFEGAGYYPLGLYRPSEDSIMRTLGREFNVVGREAMIAGFHRHASMLSASAPAGRRLTAGDTVRVGVTRLTGTGAQPELRWYLDGRELTAARGARSLGLDGLLPAGDRRAHRLTATVGDPTAAVRDPELRRGLTDSLTWPLAR